MFYSHEILTSRQYGVATVWLVATIGKSSSSKKVTRKAIQEVNVQRACAKILEPGAPIALRLQGNLLYGVSRVYNQQCNYLATDAQKTQMHMMAFFNKLGTSETDPDAGRTNPENLVITDDPDFHPTMELPQFDLEALIQSQQSMATSSQMSPPQSSFLNGSRGSSVQGGFSPALNLQPSDPSTPRSPIGLQGLSSGHKQLTMGDNGSIFGEEDQFAAPGDWGMEIDENGNIIEVGTEEVPGEDLRLPSLPSIGNTGIMDIRTISHHQQTLVDDQGDVVMFGEEPLPEAEALPERRQHDCAQKETDIEIREAPSQQKKKKKKIPIIMADTHTMLLRDEIRKWQSDYVVNCTVRTESHTTTVQAKKNAVHLIFGLGIGNVGGDLGMSRNKHPLSVKFSGDILFTALTGLEAPTKSRGKRRRAAEAIEDPEDEGRRVRPRLEEKVENPREARGGDDEAGDIFNLGDVEFQSPAEVGRDAPSVMDDHPSSAMPWNRPSSSVRGGPGSAHPGSSPLKMRGSAQDIIRYSDDDADGRGFGPMGDIGSCNSSFSGLPLTGPEALATKKLETEQAEVDGYGTLDNEGQNFLDYVEKTATENGERRRDDDVEQGRKWVALDDMFIPRKTSRSVATQAFYHTLTLATKSKVMVEQEGDEREPYGAIWIGVKVPSLREA